MNFDKSHSFMQDFVFIGLKNLNTGFDSPVIFHCLPSNFRNVIDRCELLRVQIIGIEVFSPDVELLQIEICPEPGFDWARRLVQEYEDSSGTTFCATFDVPDTAPTDVERR